jgi:hypothetical protein
MSILKTLVEQTRNEERLQETLEAAQDRAGGTVAKAILLLALEEPQDLLEQLRLLQQQAPDSDLPVIYLAYGLSGDPGAQDALLHAFAALDKRATREKDNRLYAEHHTRGWYAAEGLRELGPDRCTDETVKALVTMLQAETRNRMWAIYIVSRWGERGVARLGDDGQAFRSAVREGLGQRRSEWLSARASDAVALLPDQFPRDEAIRLLCDVLGLAPGQREVAAEEVGKRMYAKKRAAVALSKIAARDEALLEALRDHRKQVGRLTVDEKDRAHRRGLEEGLERAIRDIARRGPVTGSDEQPGSGSGGRNARESA